APLACHFHPLPASPPTWPPALLLSPAVTAPLACDFQIPPSLPFRPTRPPNATLMPSLETLPLADEWPIRLALSPTRPPSLLLSPPVTAPLASDFQIDRKCFATGKRALLLSPPVLAPQSCD